MFKSLFNAKISPLKYEYLLVIVVFLWWLIEYLGEFLIVGWTKQDICVCSIHPENNKQLKNKIIYITINLFLKLCAYEATFKDKETFLIDILIVI